MKLFEVALVLTIIVKDNNGFGIFYLDKSAKEHADYEKAMEEYKKPKPIISSKEGLMKQRMLELKRRKNDVKSSDDDEDDKNEAVVAGDIPIFSKEFLAYNKSQESKCKKLRKMVSALQEEKISSKLTSQNTFRLSEKIKLVYGQQPGMVQWSTKIKQRWTKLLIDALAYVSIDGERISNLTKHRYLHGEIKKLVTENPSSKDLIAVRMALSEVILVEQLAKNDDSCLSHRGLSLNELCRQLGHYNINVRRGSVIGVKQLLSSHPELISKHLHILIPAVGRLIACDKSDSSFHAQLRTLLELLCTMNASTMSSHFTLLMAHILRALTHLRMSVRMYALTILTLLMRTYPDLCRNSIDLFDSFLLVDSVHVFLRTFLVEKCATVGPLHVASVSIRNKSCTMINLFPTTPLIDFCVLGSQPRQSKSSLYLPDKFLLALSGILSLFLVSASEEESPSNEKEWAEIFGMLSKILLQIHPSSQTVHFEEELKKTLSGISSLLKNGNLPKRIHNSLQALNSSSDRLIKKFKHGH
ncbi:BMA-HMG-20, isoform a [Dirofilaria immitis]|nr:BMA-HMG-20, isoform a [Dirofilaria immitis]